jgi:hypothetical protein
VISGVRTSEKPESALKSETFRSARGFPILTPCHHTSGGQWLKMSILIPEVEDRIDNHIQWAGPGDSHGIRPGFFRRQVPESNAVLFSGDMLTTSHG